MESDIDLYVNSLRFEKGLSHHTIAAYASDLAQGLLYFRRAGLASWQQLTEAQFIDFLHQRSKADKPASFARRLAVFSFLPCPKAGVGPPAVGSRPVSEIAVSLA